VKLVSVKEALWEKVFAQAPEILKSIERVEYGE
jgi:hypothetical protein